MADKINAAGYETKPWWPYVRELMEGGGSVTVEQLNVTENGTYTAEAGKAYSPVVVNVPSDFSAATVTIDTTNAPSKWNLSMNLPFLANDSIESGLEISDTDHESTYSLALYKVKAVGLWYSEDCSITMTGDGSVSGENIVINGDCTISIAGPE